MRQERVELPTVKTNWFTASPLTVWDLPQLFSVGIEPTPYSDKILSLARLPIPPRESPPPVYFGASSCLEESNF